jgi:hypothetical protein
VDRLRDGDALPDFCERPGVLALQRRGLCNNVPPRLVHPDRAARSTGPRTERCVEARAANHATPLSPTTTKAPAAGAARAHDHLRARPAPGEGEVEETETAAEQLRDG